MNDKNINLGKYLQARNERKVAIIGFIIFVLFYATGGLVLAAKGARYFSYISVGNVILMLLTSLVLLQPVTIVHQVEKQRPEWKKESSKEVPLSQSFFTRASLIFVGSGLVLAMLFGHALSNVHEPVKTSILPVQNETTVISELPKLQEED